MIRAWLQRRREEKARAAAHLAKLQADLIADGHDPFIVRNAWSPMPSVRAAAWDAMERKWKESQLDERIRRIVREELKRYE